ncbi:MAG TPA: UDP-N-acetylmuramate dehydrogenase [Gammaproteobacteria bacterium]
MSELDAFADVRRNEPMRRHTSWRVGGPADLFFEPTSEDDLARFLAALPPATPVHFVGLGSNLLVRDGGVRGAVISTRKLGRRIERLDETRVRAGAGVPCATFARQCVRWSLGPAAFFAGIPGTIGGALAMNAGAFGGETWDRVESVETIDRGGTRRTYARGDFEIGYRSVRLAANLASAKLGSEPFFAGGAGDADDAASKKGSDPNFAPNTTVFAFLSGTFRFDRDDAADMSAIRALLDKRAATQPLGVPSCGSVFRNPEGTHAGALIEQAGLKGLRIGGAQVSEKHANFIINTGAATADDIERLIETVQRRVAERTGITLTLEARVIGERRREGDDA